MISGSGFLLSARYAWANVVAGDLLTPSLGKVCPNIVI